MKLKTVRSLFESGAASMLARLAFYTTPFYRVCFLGSAVNEGLLALLREGPMTLEAIAAQIAPAPEMRDGLRAWLDFGVGVGALRESGGKYWLRGLARRLADPANDTYAAMFQEMVLIDAPPIVRTPAMLRGGRRFNLSEQDGTIIARSSRVLEPFIFEKLDELVPATGAMRILDVGCGSGVYLRRAAERNPQVIALGLELQPEVAEFARANLRTWNLEGRAAVESADVRTRTAAAEFDLVMLNNNIYYFPNEERPTLLRHLGDFLKPGGKLLVTTACRGQNGRGATEILHLWGVMTDGGAPLPTRAEMREHLRAAGFDASRGTRLVPGYPMYAFVATRRATP